MGDYQSHIEIFTSDLRRGQILLPHVTLIEELRYKIKCLSQTKIFRTIVYFINFFGIVFFKAKIKLTNFLIFFDKFQRKISENCKWQERLINKLLFLMSPKIFLRLLGYSKINRAINGLKALDIIKYKYFHNICC